jgi:hypothetical protein
MRLGFSPASVVHGDVNVALPEPASDLVSDDVGVALFWGAVAHEAD